MTDGNPNILPAYPTSPPPAPAYPDQAVWATRKQSGPLMKMMSKMLKGPKATTRKSPSRGRGKGIAANQNVHIKHVKFY